MSRFTIDPTIAQQVADLVTEVSDGPSTSGMVTTLRVGKHVVEASASRGWGISFNRELPGGGMVERFVPAAGLDIDAAGAALRELIKV